MGCFAARQKYKARDKACICSSFSLDFLSLSITSTLTLLPVLHVIVHRALSQGECDTWDTRITVQPRWLYLLTNFCQVLAAWQYGHILSFPNFHHRCYRQPLPRPYPMDGCRGWWPLVSSSSPTSCFGLVLNPMLCSYFLFYRKHWHSKSLFRIVFLFLVFSTLKSWVFGIFESFNSRDSEENGSTSYVFEMTT